MLRGVEHVSGPFSLKSGDGYNEVAREASYLKREELVDTKTAPEEASNTSFRQDLLDGLIVKEGGAAGVETIFGGSICAKAVLLATGGFPPSRKALKTSLGPTLLIRAGRKRNLKEDLTGFGFWLCPARSQKTLPKDKVSTSRDTTTSSPAS